MKLAVDVDYRGSRAAVAGVAFESWRVGEPFRVFEVTVENVPGYESGRFYRRELPCILALLHKHDLEPDVIVIDGYVYLDGHTQPGLGKHLFDALAGRAAVIGVAKRPRAGIGPEFEVRRGRSAKPLYVTCAGMDLEEARECIGRMHGAYRMPTLLKAVDRICRNLQPAPMHSETTARAGNP